MITTASEQRKGATTRLMVTVLLACSSGLYAQSKPDDKEPAAFREAFNAIDIGSRDKPSQKSRIQTDLDVSRPVVAAFLINKMNHWADRRGDNLPHTVIACMLYTDPRKHMAWLIDSFDKLSPVGRLRMVQSFCLLDYAEAYEIVLSFLDDRTKLPSRRWGEPPPYQAYEMRVCDYAFNTVALMLERSRETSWQPGLARRVAEYETVDKRDQAIADFSQWWVDSGHTILAKKPRLEKEDSPLAMKAKKFIERPKNTSSKPSSGPSDEPTEHRGPRRLVF